jgi:hypothetical protein
VSFFIYKQRERIYIIIGRKEEKKEKRKGRTTVESLTSREIGSEKRRKKR